jgi:hypothetical protein
MGDLMRGSWRPKSLPPTVRGPAFRNSRFARSCRHVADSCAAAGRTHPSKSTGGSPCAGAFLKLHSEGRGAKHHGDAT